MLPSWMRSRNCRPRLVYFLAMEMTRRRLASTISFLAWRASRSPFCTALTMRRNSGISRPVSDASVWISPRSFSMRIFSFLTNVPHLRPRPPTRSSHVWSSSLPKYSSMNAWRGTPHDFSQAHQLAFLADELLVDAVELLDEALDAVVVERQALHVDDDLVAQLVVGLLLLLGALLAGNLLLELLVLLLAQLLVGRRRCGRRFPEPSASARLPWRRATARSRSRPRRPSRLRGGSRRPLRPGPLRRPRRRPARAAAAWPPGPRRWLRDR